MTIAFFYFGFACVCGVLANTRGRHGFGWFVLALLISPILAGAFLLALPKREGVVAPTSMTVPAPGPITPRTMGILTLAVAAIGLVVVFAIVNGTGAPATRSASVVPSAPGYVTQGAPSAPRYIDDGTGHQITEDEAIARVDAAAGGHMTSSAELEKDAALAKEAGTTPEVIHNMRQNFRDAGVSDEGFERLIDGISRQVVEDYPDMMENIRTDAARREEAARRFREACERLRDVDPEGGLSITTANTNTKRIVPFASRPGWLPRAGLRVIGPPAHCRSKMAAGGRWQLRTAIHGEGHPSLSRRVAELVCT